MRAVGKTVVKVGQWVGVGLVLTSLTLAGCSSGTPGGLTTGPATTVPVVSSPPVTTATPPNPGVDTVSCTYSPDGSAAKPVTAPDGQAVPASGTVSIVLHMDAGDVPITLDRANAPCAVNSLVWLVRQGYFDDTRCHRLVSDFVLQCGDPTGSGMGGPGYRFADELTGTERYTVGTVAMANAGANTNGSQFFIAIGARAAALPPAYVVLGQVSADGMAVVGAIAAQGVDPADPAGIRPAEGGHIISISAS